MSRDTGALARVRVSMKKLPPHPATVIQRRTELAQPSRPPPHPATVRAAQARFPGLVVSTSERPRFDPQSARSVAHPATRVRSDASAKTVQRMRSDKDQEDERDKGFPQTPCPVTMGEHVGVNVRFVTLGGSDPSKFAAMIDSFVEQDELDDRSDSSEETPLPKCFAEEVKQLRQKFGEKDDDDLNFCSAIFNDDEREGALSTELREYLKLLGDDESSREVEDPPMSKERRKELMLAVRERLGVLILVADPSTALCRWTLSPPSKNNHPGANLLSFSAPKLGLNAPLAYYLPYAADRMTCLALGDQADWFFTDVMEGCSLCIVGTPTAPLVCHANVRSIDDVDCKREVVQVLLDSATKVIDGESTVSATLLREHYFEAGFTAFVWGRRDTGTGEWHFFYWCQLLSLKNLSGSKVESTKTLL